MSVSYSAMMSSQSLTEFTKKESHEETQASLSARQEQVYSTLAEHTALNNRMLGEKAGLPVNCVTPRVKELREQGVVEEAGVFLDPVTKRKTVFWKVKE